MANSKMSYATGYLLKISKDAMFDSPTRVSRSLATTPSGSPFSNRTASPIKLKFGRRSPTSPLQDLCRGDGWEDHSENSQQDTASVVAALAKSRKRKTAVARPLAGEENLQHLTIDMDQPSNKRRRKQEVEQEVEQEAGVVAAGHSMRGSAFLPVSPSDRMDADSRGSVTPSSSNASFSKSSSVTMEDYTEKNAHGATRQCTNPSWHKVPTPPVTQWKKLTLPSNLQQEEPSTEVVALEHNGLVNKSLYSESLPESERTRKESGAVSIKTNTIRLPEILTDTDSVSSSEGQSSTCTSRASTPALDSSLQPSPISPTPKQQLLMRLRRRYTSGLSPAPAESWDKFKRRLLNKEDGPRPVQGVKRQISREDMKKDHVRAFARVRSYLRQFSEEEQQQQKAEEERKKKDDNTKSSSLTTSAVASSQTSANTIPATATSVASLGVTQSQTTLDSGLKLPGLTLPTVGGSGGQLPSSSASGTNMSLPGPPSMAASSQPGPTPLKLGEAVAWTSAPVSAPTGLTTTAVGVGVAQPKVSNTAGSSSSLLLNPLQSSTVPSNLTSSSSQSASGFKLGTGVSSTTAPLASSFQFGSAPNTTTARAPSLPAVTTQSSSGLNLQFSSAGGIGVQSLQSTAGASGGPALLSFTTATGQPLKGATNSVLGSGFQMPQMGSAVPLNTGLAHGSLFPSTTSTASFSTNTASSSLAASAGLFSQLGHTSGSSATTTTNPAGSLFGGPTSSGFFGLQQTNSQTLAAQSQFFGTPVQGGAPSQAVGLSLFGGNKTVTSSAQGSMQSQGGGIFGGVQSGQTSLFGNSNQGGSSQGLFGSSNVSQSGSILGTNQPLGGGTQGIQQSTALLGGGGGAQPSTSSLFGTQSNATPLSTSIFGNVKPPTSQSGPLSFSASSIMGAALGTPPTFNFAAQSTGPTSMLSQLGNGSGSSTTFNQPAQGLTFSATPQINFSATSFSTPPLGGSTTAQQTPATARRPFARAARRTRGK